MKKHAFWFQMFVGISIITAGIILIVLKTINKIPIDGLGAFGLLIVIMGVFSCNETHKTQKRFQKLFQKNEEDKVEIEKMRKEILK